jgi:outer membrane protein assembly factor BamD
LATCYYELIVDEKKDLSSLENSKKYYRILIKDYPNTDFALDAKYKLDLINNVLASKEIYIGKFYLTKSKWIPAMNRFKNVVDNYSNTEYVEEALHRLVEINYKLGLTNEARNYASLLGYNYQSSRWYEESYKIFNKDYAKTETKEISKNRSFIIRKFKDLFE